MSGGPAARAQADLFAAPEPELFDAAAAPVLYRADPEAVRASLHRLLAEARAPSPPWDDARARLYATLVPQMSLWLPEDEGRQLRLAFADALERRAAA